MFNMSLFSSISHRRFTENRPEIHDPPKDAPTAGTPKPGTQKDAQLLVKHQPISIDIG